MSTSPDSPGPSDRLVSAISLWLARHLNDQELLNEIAEVDTHGLAGEQAEAVQELVQGLQAGRERGELEMVAREALEAVALGG
jgi:hypothetical protein